jgi:hypothetical protein
MSDLAKINLVADAITKEIPVNHLNSFLTKFADEAAKGNCGAGCGSGCCGAACSASPEDLGVIDAYGHLNFNSADLNQIGTANFNDLKLAVKDKIKCRRKQLINSAANIGSRCTSQ